MHTFYMVRCVSGGFTGWLNDGLLHTTDRERAALFPTEASARYHIKLAQDGRMIAKDYELEPVEDNFAMPTRDLEMVLDNSN